MSIRFARRVELVKASEIREILKVTVRPEVISFAGGLPAPERFPVDELRRATDAVLARDGREALQYSTTEGHLPLRETIVRRMQRDGIPNLSAGDLLITSGSQQGLDLLGKLLLDEGDVVLCESPTYLGMIQAFSVFQPRFAGVATDDEGMIPADLEQQLLRHPRAKLIYAIPNFQNPSGRTWSADRRQACVELATRHGVVLVEDNPYGELRFEGEAVPSLRQLDRDGGVVVYLGTFSKIFCPGLRLAWIAGPRAIIEKLVLLKQGADLHTSTFAQHVLAEYLATNDVDANVAELRTLYRRRRDAMLAAMARELPPGIRHTRPQGGLFLWAELPGGIDARELLEAALAENVAFVPGGAFFPNGGHENTLRLNYSNMPEPRITEGIGRLGRVLRKMMA